MSHTLCLDGLPSWMTSSQLHLLCIFYGHTISAQIITDTEGRSLQFGIAEMASEEDARQVVMALDGMDELDGTSRLVYVAQMPRQEGTGSEPHTSESRHGELVFG